MYHLYHIMAVSVEECAKADADPNYPPTEHQVGQVWATSEREAQTHVRQGIRHGTYHRSAAAVWVREAASLPPGAQVL